MPNITDPTTIQLSAVEVAAASGLTHAAVRRRHCKGTFKARQHERGRPRYSFRDLTAFLAVEMLSAEASSAVPFGAPGAIRDLVDAIRDGRAGELPPTMVLLLGHSPSTPAAWTLVPEGEPLPDATRTTFHVPSLVAEAASEAELSIRRVFGLRRDPARPASWQRQVASEANPR